MSTEALALALVSIVRPTTAAAVWAMLVGSRPRRLLTVYLVAGLAVSLPVGIGVVLLAGDTFTPRRGADIRGVLLLSLGVAALLAALAVQLGWRERFRSDQPDAAREPRRLTPRAAATAGVVTHLPGVFYLAALGAIAGTGAAAGGAVLQVVVYNAVWYSPAIVALGLCLFGAVPSADRLAGPLDWVRGHVDAILTVSFALVGVWLVVQGVTDLR
jgi:Sap, sulfolipid-1-addressing protein